MKQKICWLIRGLPNSGKTTLAKTLEASLPDAFSLAADDYYYDENRNYNWKPENVPTAHKWCQDNVRLAMKCGLDNVIVHNTNTSEKEIKPYLDLAESYGYTVTSLIVEKRHDNINDHNVPEKVIDNMEQRLRNSIKLR